MRCIPLQIIYIFFLNIGFIWHFNTTFLLFRINFLSETYLIDFLDLVPTLISIELNKKNDKKIQMSRDLSFIKDKGLSIKTQINLETSFDAESRNKIAPYLKKFCKCHAPIIVLTFSSIFCNEFI